MAHPLLALGLIVFWLLLSGHYTALLIGLGGGSVLLILWLMGRLDEADGTRVRLRPTPGLLRYLPWLFGQVVRANLEVSRRILDPRLPVKPVCHNLEVDLDSDLQKTLYANSITLTPDTFTLQIRDDGRFLVHALHPGSIEALRGGAMQRRVQQTRI